MRRRIRSPDTLYVLDLQSLGIDITSAAAAILDAGDAQHIVDQVVSSIAKIKGGKTDQ